MGKEGQNLPFGLNLTKRTVSEGAERALYVPRKIGGSGVVELVDYMGSDEMVVNVATAGRGPEVFHGERITSQSVIRYLAYKGIYNPFRSAQFKFRIQSSIALALALVYAEGASVNELSARYSMLPETSQDINLERILSRPGFLMTEGEKERVREEFQKNRQRSLRDYRRLLDKDIDFTRELARGIIGVDNDTLFYWNMDLPSMVDFLRVQKARIEKGDLMGDYIKAIEEVVKASVPLSWNALNNLRLGDRPVTSYGKPIRMVMPSDEEVVDPPLSPAPWKPNITKRPTVEALEEKLFETRTYIDHGEFQVVDYMGDDLSPAQAARASYGSGTNKLSADHKLVESLVRDAHVTPLEMVKQAVRYKSPVFVAPRQTKRHRHLPEEGFMGENPIGSQAYLPARSEIRFQDRKDRQGRGEEMPEDKKDLVLGMLKSNLDLQLEASRELRRMGASERVVRRAKGVGFYTVNWKIGDGNNWSRFLGLRLDGHAQKEVRDLSVLVSEAQRLHTPVLNSALRTYVVESMRLSSKEVAFVRDLIAKGKLIGMDYRAIEPYMGTDFVTLNKARETVHSREGQELVRKLERLLNF